MSDEPSPRPWHIMRYTAEDEPDRIIDANGDEVAIELLEADAAFIVDAVNEHDRLAADEARYRAHNVVLRDLVRRLITIRENLFWRKDERTGLMYYDTTIDEDDARRTIEEARAAIGEDEK